MHNLHKILLLLTFLWLPVTAFCNDLVSTLSLVKNQVSTRYTYTETRDMSLLNTPWQGSGEMVVTPDLFFLNQELPKPIAVLIQKHRIDYLDVTQGKKRTRHLDRPYDAPGIGQALKILFDNPTEEFIKKRFKPSLQITESRWKLELVSRHFTNNGFQTLNLSGEENQPPSTLTIEQYDGDKTTWNMTPVETGESAEAYLQSILEKLGL